MNLLGQELSGVLPKNNAVVSTPNVSFVWNKKKNVSSYTVEIATNFSFTTGLVQISNLLVNSSSQLVSPGSYYWRVIGHTGAVSDTGAIAFFDHWKPSEETSLSFWINADSGFVLDGSNKVQSYTDLSSNGWTLSQPTASKRPSITTAQIGGKPSFSFAGGQWLTGGDVLDLRTNSRAVFCVGKMANSNQTLFSKTIAAQAPSRYGIIKDGTQTASIYEDNNEHHIYTTQNITNYAFYFDQIDRVLGQHLFFINGVQAGLTSINPNFDHNSTSRFLLGAYNNATNNGELLLLNGNISEIFFFDTDDSLTIDRGKKYLKHKYHTLDLGPDKVNDSSFCNTTLTVPSGFTNPTWSTGQTSSSISVSTEGIYWLKAYDPLGFEWRDTIFVDYPDIAPPPALGICSGSNVAWNVDLGSGFSYQWSNGLTTPSVSITNPGNYSVTVTGFGGCQRTSPVSTFYIDNYEQTATMGPDTLMCSGNTLSLQVGASETVSYLWPDGSNNPTYAVDTTGNYYVSTININGCTAQDTIHVTITGQAPLADFSATDFCLEESVDFTDLSTPVGGDVIGIWTWNFGDGNSSNQQNPSHQYQNVGNFAVQLTVESQGGCKEVITKNVRILNLPYASFSIQGECSNDFIQFSDLSTLGDTSLLSWSWDFDQPSSPTNTSSLMNPTHLFDAFGSFDVSLLITDENGCFNDTVITLQVQEAPNATFSMNEACENDAVNFVNSSTIGSPNALTGFSWQFDDNTSSSQTNPTKTYSEFGFKTILLTANADNGCQDTVYGFVLIHDIPYPQPSIAPACVGTYTGLFDNSICITDTIQASEWYIDFTHNAEGDPAYYVFQSPGNHKVILVTRSEFGCQNDTLVNINVAPELSAEWEFYPQTVVAEQEVEFTYTGLAGTIFDWSFGNGDSSNSENPILIYSDNLAGTQVPVQLIVSNSIGCLDTLTRNLDIKRGELELIVQNIFFQDIDGYLTTGIQLVNQGTVRIDSVRLELELSNGSQFLEYYTTPLLSGQSKIYVLNTKPASYFSEYDDEDAWICVKGEPVPAILIDETDRTNNRSCINIEGERPVLIGPNPNPVVSQMNFEVLLKNEGEIELDLLNAAGQNVAKIVPLTLLESGQYSYSFDVSLISTGVYYLRLQSPQGTLLRKLLIH